jgi:hypothetical protein
VTCDVQCKEKNSTLVFAAAMVNGFDVHELRMEKILEKIETSSFYSSASV